MLLSNTRCCSIFLLFACFGFITTRTYAEPAKKLYKQGVAAEQHGDLELAFKLYTTAQDVSPAEVTYKLAVERIRPALAQQHIRLGEQLRRQSHSKEALVEFLRALEVDPGNALAQQDIESTRDELDRKTQNKQEDDEPSAEDLDRPAPPVHLDPLSTEPLTIDMTEDSRILYESIGKLAGVNVLLDPDFVSKRVTIKLKNVTPVEALRVLGDLSNTFWKPSTHNTIYVAPDTRQKRTQLQQEALKIFYLSNVSQQTDLNDVVTTLRNVLAADSKLYAVAAQNAVVVRGTPDVILLAKQIIMALDRPKPEVLVDVYVMEVSRQKMHNIGLSPPTSFSVTQSSTTTTDSSGNTTSTGSTLNQVGDSSSYSYSIGQAAVELLLTDSETRVLQNPNVRAIDGQEASINIGSKIPIATGSYSTPTTTTTAAVQTQFQYIDTGVTIKVTPTIHENHDVTMKIHVEISSQTGTDTISGVAEPVLSQEKAEQVIRVKDGEASVLAGLVSDQLQRAVSGWPGLGEVPGIKYMFSNQQTTKTTDELVFMVVPHIVRAPQNSAGAAREIEIGNSQSIRIDRIPVKPVTPVFPVKSDQKTAQ